MKRRLILFAAAFFVTAKVSAIATHYVDLNSTNPVAPYTSWDTAATNINFAINAATYGDIVLVTNGVYDTGNGGNAARVNVNRSLVLQSVNGPSVTIIKGAWDAATNGPNALRCVYLANGATLSGFTLTGGATSTTSGNSGGGVYCESNNGRVTNCVIVGNSAWQAGGGAYLGTLVNCKIINNICGLPSVGNGGGAAQSLLTNCIVAGNIAGYTSGGIGGGTAVNCTVVSNFSAAYNGGVGGTVLKNSIVYYNTAYYTISPTPDPGTGNFTNCCLFPLPGSGAVNCVTNPPQFANLAAGDYHLTAISPCINTGSNSFVVNGVDLDGNPRIVGGVVDMGAYEFQSPVHYVKPPAFGATPVPPYTNWISAATNIQDAIDAAAAGDFIVVSNGTYNSGGRAVYGIATNRVTVDKALTLQSLNGPGATTIAGFTVFASDYEIRCVYLTNGATLAGFTLSGGASRHSGDVFEEQSGGGVWCEDNSVVVSNCIVSGNNSGTYGGGAFRGTFVNCFFTNNSGGFGGAACSNVLVNCTLIKNIANQQNFNSGGGAFGCTLSNCVIVGNTCNGGRGGGGAYLSTLTGCVVSNNVAVSGNGGGVCFGIANNSLISSNRAGTGGGACSNVLINCLLKNNLSAGNGGGAYNSTLLDSTVVSNAASFLPANVAGGGVFGGTESNCIVYFNSCSGGGGTNFDSCTMSFCDTTPLPDGSGNITNEPNFVNLAGGDFHLQPESPCIDAGDNGSVQGDTDLDGRARIIGSTVDMGAYEFPYSFQDFYAWLQQYGLPTDGTANFIDSDGDGLNNWQEWRAGTNPTNALSVLKLMSNTPTNNPPGLVVTWQSVSGIIYFLQSSANLAVQPAFSTIQSNIVGQAGTTGYIDATATNGGPYFYRVGVQQ